MASFNAFAAVLDECRRQVECLPSDVRIRLAEIQRERYRKVGASFGLDSGEAAAMALYRLSQDPPAPEWGGEALRAAVDSVREHRALVLVAKKIGGE